MLDCWEPNIPGNPEGSVVVVMLFLLHCAGVPGYCNDVFGLMLVDLDWANCNSKYDVVSTMLQLGSATVSDVGWQGTCCNVGCTVSPTVKVLVVL